MPTTRGVTARMSKERGAGAPSLGLVAAVAIVLGNMIGSGVFTLPASLAPYGGLSFAGWAVSAGGSLALALVFARLARARPAEGGPYAYTRQAFGDLPAFLVAWGYWISVWAANAALAVAFVGYLDPFIPGIVRQPPLAAALAIAVLWLLTGVSARGVREAGHVQVWTTALKVLPLVAVGVAGLAVLQPAHFAVPVHGAVPIVTNTMSVVTLTLWAFLGVECATIPAGSIHDPERTIPRATVVGTVVAAVIYMVSTAGAMGALAPAVLGRTPAPFAEAARVLFGDTAAQLVAIGAAISCFGALNGWILIVGQLPMAVAEEGLFPAVFARKSRRETPVAGLTIGAVLSSLLIASNYSRDLVSLFTFIILLATLGTLVPYFFCSLAALMNRDGRPSAGSQDPAYRSEPATDVGRVFGPGEDATSVGRVVGPGERRRGQTIVAALAFGYSLVAIAGAGETVLLLGAAALIAGLPVYAWVRRGAGAPAA
ncbi:MAG TPA: amino acid permease [Vicinamibacterales bacterium]|nr:amino acid permease [Vicinamibacterales bacterium]